MLQGGDSRRCPLSSRLGLWAVALLLHLALAKPNGITDCVSGPDDPHVLTFRTNAPFVIRLLNSTSFAPVASYVGGARYLFQLRGVSAGLGIGGFIDTTVGTDFATAPHIGQLVSRDNTTQQMNDRCSTGLTHTFPTPKLVINASFIAPRAGTEIITFYAIIVEDYTLPPSRAYLMVPERGGTPLPTVTSSGTGTSSHSTTPSTTATSTTTPTMTATSTMTPTASASLQSLSHTPSYTRTSTKTPSSTRSPTATTGTATASQSGTRSQTSTQSPSQSGSASGTGTGSTTASVSVTASVSSSGSATLTQTSSPSVTPSHTRTRSRSYSTTPTFSPKATTSQSSTHSATASHSPACPQTLFRMLPRTDLVGTLVGSAVSPGTDFTAPSVDACRQSCCETTACSAFTFANHWSSCLLYANVTETVPSSVLTSGTLLSVYP